MASNNRQVSNSDVVWFGKPWILPAALNRTITVVVITTLFLGLEYYSGEASIGLFGLPVWGWTLLIFAVIWLVSMLGLLVFRFSNTYVLRQDSIEVKRGILRLHSFVVTPSGFGDLLVYQSIGGRIFGYGDVTVNSQGGRETKLLLVRGPFAVADAMRDILGKPTVRVENHV